MIEFFAIITTMVIFYFAMGLHSGEFGKQVNENMKTIGGTVLAWIMAVCIITAVFYIIGGLLQ